MILFESERKNIFKRVCHVQPKIVHKYIFHYISRTLVLDWSVLRGDEDLSIFFPYECLLMLLMHQVQTFQNFPMCDSPWKLPYNNHFRKTLSGGQNHDIFSLDTQWLQFALLLHEGVPFPL